MDSIYSGLYIEDDRLSTFAASFARLLKVDGRCFGSDCAADLRRDCGEIRRCHDAVEKRCANMPEPPAACEWLLDNWYMVRREYLCALGELKAASSLRRCGREALISALCAELVKSGHGEITEQRCRAFLDGFQSVTVLRRAELSLFPAALRGAVIGGIAEVCRKMQYAADTEPHAKAMAALFGSLRLLASIDTEKLVSAADVSNAILAADPSGDYPKMDAATKGEYLRRLEKQARRQGMEEHQLASKLIKRAKSENRHVGCYLFRRASGAGGALYIGANLLLTLFLSLLAAFASGSFWAALLLVLPVSELVKSLMDYILLRLLRPTLLPRMDMSKGVPEEGRSICVITSILGGGDASRLEELRLASRSEGTNLCFGLLADLPEADSEHIDGDGALIQEARKTVEQLNRKYGGGFYLFTRQRSFDGERYSGAERKRGAILELARLLTGEESALSVTGEKDALKDIRYIITLDSDTRVYPGSLGELIGAALHPLVRPVIDPKLRRVVSGHAILHPRMETELQSANATDFALVFAGAGGCDPYGGVCGELYMDAFQNGGFAGKGLIDARALIDCTAGRFPDRRILSHDALEGAYLRGGYMGDAAFSDRFPARPLAYYKRLHRWIRGDWQNAPWIFARELTDMDRFRLFDSLRRSLIAPATLIAVTAGFFLEAPGLKMAAWAALLSLLSGLFISLAEESRARTGTKLRRHTRLLTGVGGAIVRAFLRLWLLPYEGWVCLTAAVTALWRMLISRRRLLQWQTAAQSESGGAGLAEHIKAMWFPIVLGLLLMVFSPAVIGKAAGFMWLTCPAAAAALALPAWKDRELSPADRDYLKSAAAQCWRYLADYSGPEDSYLPADNFQEQPPVGAAHRSSPTNMGLAMAAATAAADMEIITPREAAEYIGRMAGSMEKLPRLMGHFYNWYDTRSMRPLKPEYISTVDSGNLYAGLLSAREAAVEWGEAALAERLTALMAPMDFSPLYDWGRGLFYICYDAAKRRGAGGWYDLLASEAMLTSYLAIAKGDVPKKHWRRLSRAQLQKDGYRGLASWTGTMFEYLMPFLFLPLYRSSLLYESGRFCLYAQRRRAFAGKPWGISESAFYSLDAALNYRYKAHGCPALALKRGQEADMVISPYSSFLALAIEPQAAVKNLRRLESFGALGRYGYMEALDFTPGRCRTESGEQVRCYMAHHESMSLIAAANVLCRRSVAARFSGEAAMDAHSLLLQEKLPSDAPVIRRDMAEAPEKPRRDVSQQWRLRGDSQEGETHRCLLSNGAYNLSVDSGGGSTGDCGGICVYKEEPESRGVELLLDGQALLRPERIGLWELGEERCRFSGQAGTVEFTADVSAALGDCGELRRVELRASESREAELKLRFRPILASLRDYESHPAFWQLGITAELEDGRLLLHRLSRENARGQWLCVMCSERAEFSADRDGGLGPLAAPWAELRVRLTLRRGETAAVLFALCLSPERKEALEGAERILLSRGANPGCMPGAAAALLGMSGAELGAAMELVQPLTDNPLSEAAPRRELWQYGISGDWPMICCDGRSSESGKLLRRFCLLKSCGLGCELVFLSDEAGEYMQPLLRRISQSLSQLGLEALIGSPGGVFLVPSDAGELIRSRAAVVVGEAAKSLRPLSVPSLGSGRKSGSVPEFRQEERCFRFTVMDTLPSRVWQHMLTNGNFGYLASDCGMGNMWLKNAREMRISPAPQDLRGIRGPERIYLETEGRAVSLFAANDGLRCTVSFGPGWARWEKELGGRRITTTAFIPAGIDARVLLVEGAEGLTLRWGLELCMGAADGSSALLREDKGLLRCRNPEAYLTGSEFLLSCSGSPRIRCGFVPAAAELTVIAEASTALVCGCCQEVELRELCRTGFARELLEVTQARWDALIGRFRLESPYGALDAYMSTWAAYQCIAGRLEGRSSLYQSGGALGFRDQLQDGVNMLLLSPAYAREQIIDCCRHQYVEGDVMHWWHRHPEGDRGVRTRCSDDLLWLVWALCRYLEATGEYALCLREEPYIHSEILRDDEKDRYETPEQSDASASVLDHAKGALERCISRGFGEHGLPFFGSGDWNDALNRSGGESVWLGWFFSACADDFADLLERLGKPDAGRYRAYAERVGAAADACWNGRWYLRGYAGDGRPLGDGDRIDSLPQSFAAFSRHASADRVDKALTAALTRLTDRGNGLIKLFDPPYAEEDGLGYISSYGPGFRENGGQYTHGAIWLAMACFCRGMAPEGTELLQMLLPENREPGRYGAEPFVLAADVCAAKGREGTAGWSWYTGSAGWYFRAVTQCMLGLSLKGGRLSIKQPPSSAPAPCAVLWTDRRGTVHRLEYSRDGIKADGQEYEGGEIG